MKERLESIYYLEANCGGIELENGCDSQNWLSFIC